MILDRDKRFAIVKTRPKPKVKQIYEQAKYKLWLSIVGLMVMVAKYCQKSEKL